MVKIQATEDRRTKSAQRRRLSRPKVTSGLELRTLNSLPKGFSDGVYLGDPYVSAVLSHTLIWMTGDTRMTPAKFDQIKNWISSGDD